MTISKSNKLNLIELAFINESEMDGFIKATNISLDLFRQVNKKQVESISKEIFEYQNKLNIDSCKKLFSKKDKLIIESPIEELFVLFSYTESYLAIDKTNFIEHHKYFKNIVEALKELRS